MKDYLLQMCVDRDIELFYSNNPSPVLSSYVQNGVRNIVAYYVFRECPEELAAAIVNYYTQDKGKQLNFNIIKSFLKNNFKSETCKIDSVEIVFKEEIKEKPVMKIEEKVQEEVPPAKEQKPKTKRQTETKTKSQTEPNTKPKTQSKKQNEINIVVEENEPPDKPKPKQKRASTPKKPKASGDKNEVVEMGIKSMTKKSFKGNTTEIMKDESIRVAEDDVVELDITIDPFNT